MLYPKKDKIYRPTSRQWQTLEVLTEFSPIGIIYSEIELVNFATSMLHLKSGALIGFDGVSEDEYVFACNGGYYEEAPPIKLEDRV